MKENLKKNKFLRRLVQKVKSIFGITEFYKDYKLFKKNYMYSSNDLTQMEYRALLLIHSIEKGFLHSYIRPFAKDKVIELIEVLKQIAKQNKASFSFVSGINVLRSFVDCYEENEWTEKKYEEYWKAKEAIERWSETQKCNMLSKKIRRDDITVAKEFDFLDAVQKRHSVREYEKKEILEKDLEYAIRCAIKAPSACNRQMCKVYSIKEKKNKEILLQFGQGFSGFDTNSSNLFLITFDIAAFSYVGERNQGYFNSGLFAMNFCNGLHTRGIGSCFVQFGNKIKQEKNIKKIIGIPQSERIAVILSAGYYKKEFSVTASERKPISDYLIKK